MKRLTPLFGIGWSICFGAFSAFRLARGSGEPGFNGFCVGFHVAMIFCWIGELYLPLEDPQ